MIRTAIHAALAATLLMACSDDSTGNIVDGSVAGDTGGPAADTGGPAADTGGPVADTGGPVADTGGPVADTGGPVADAGGLTCDPSFGAAQACGGTLSGTKWKYTTGCVSPAAFDDLKQSCPGAVVSNVAYAMANNNTLQFFANGSMVRVFNGQISGKGSWPQSCVKVGCGALQAGLALLLLKYPGSTVTCTAATGGGCDCNVMIKIFQLAGGQYAVSGSTVTVTAASTAYPYHFCVKGNAMTYAGTAQNPTDRNVTYVLTKTN